ncbi:MAG: TetR/AcrR family transcriptional regulator [Treponema sp.]|nr:TetR/AcrR family transcriptional regulator [Treponema sp.]
MAIVVEHDKRRHEILERSLDVFATEGYEDTTFQKIADSCGVTRTTLYIYFDNKKDIFIGSLKQILIAMEMDLNAIIDNPELSAHDALYKMAMCIIDYCEQNLKLFNVLHAYLLGLKRTKENPREKINRRIIRMRHMLSTVIIRGIKSGEFKKDLNVHSVVELIYILVESSIFRIAVLESADLSEVRKAIAPAIDGLVQ